MKTKIEKTNKTKSRYFDNVEMIQIEKTISNIEKDIYEMVCQTPDGCDSLVWPLGVPPPHKPANRHEVIRWDYFNATHLFLGTDFDVVEEFTRKIQLRSKCKISFLFIKEKIFFLFLFLKRSIRMT